MATAEQSQSIAVPVESLQPGLYVHALDRPWVETPFVFQGFRLTREDELETLRAYCRHVYIDLQQSDAAAARAVLAAGRQRRAPASSPGPDRGGPPRERPLPGPAAAATGVLFEPVPHPDRERFGALVRRAARSHDDTRRAVSEVLRRARLEQAIDTGPARAAVEEMAALVAEDASAALWLTHLARRDPYTVTHSVNACVLALAFGRHLGMDGERLQRLGLGTLLMDIGKATIPQWILDKPSALTATERAFVNLHVVRGCTLLAQGDLPLETLDVVRMHHERLDGEGYPAGLGGDEIPRQALIAGLADTHDAMLRTRPYRGAYRPDRALQALYEDAAGTFGQELVEAFIRYLGAYPVGTLVRLDNDAVGIVVGSRPGGGLLPTVLLLRNADGEPFRKRLLLNLSAAGRDGVQVAARSIRATLGPREANVDVGKLVAQEFGLAA